MSHNVEDYAAHSFGQPGPDLTLQRRAIDAAKAHPLYRDAAAHVYCQPIVMAEPKTFLEGTRYPDEIKKRVATALAGVDRIVLVTFCTSTKIPKPLSGHGMTYDFILHPDSMEILHAGTGTWRS